MSEYKEILTPEQNLIPPVVTIPKITAEKSKFEFQPHDTVFAWLAAILGVLMMRYVVFVADGFPATLCFW